MGKQDLRVLVVDDTALYRRIVSDVVADIDGAQVLGTAYNGQVALQKVEKDKPDLVLLDVEMPGMDGLETLRAIKKRFPGVGVVMVSGTSRSAANITIEALESGALDFVPKPQSRSPEQSRRELVQVLGPILGTFRTKSLLRSARPSTHGRAAQSRPVASPRAGARRSAAAPASQRPIKAPRAGSFGLIAVGCSTGGPAALSKLVPKLDPRLRQPIVLVQHMPPGFTASLAAQLDKKSAIRVEEAQEGQALIPGGMLIAPGGRHMVVRRRGGTFSIGLNSSPPVKSCRPSVDVLFRSVAAAYSRPVLTVVLTGMGEDGADGVQSLARRGSYNIAQDEETCVVYGMPRAVVERDLASEVLPVERIASRINELCLARPGRRSP